MDGKAAKTDMHGTGAAFNNTYLSNSGKASLTIHIKTKLSFFSFTVLCHSQTTEGERGKVLP